MSVDLTREQEAWLNAHVARGDFPSVADAVRQLIDERIAERMPEASDDLAWARPYVEAAQADVAVCNVVTRQEHEARIDALLASMKVSITMIAEA